MTSMKTFFLLMAAVALVLTSVNSLMQTASAQSNQAKELVGLWEAKQRFGPDVRGTLLIKQTGDGWQAEIAGHIAQAKTSGDSISFELPDGKGKFQGNPYKGRTIQAFFAGGNGGQIVMGIPGLDLVVAIYAGNYADRPGREIQQAYVPKYILPAIDK